MTCPHLIKTLPDGVYCKKNGGAAQTCSIGVCKACVDGGGANATWKMRTAQAQQAILPVPHDQWPVWVLAIEKFAIDSHQGAGDTIAYLLRMLGSDALQALMKKIGAPDCKCATRQARCNMRYPYRRIA